MRKASWPYSLMTHQHTNPHRQHPWAGVLLLLLTGAAMADPPGQHPTARRDHDRARAALERGEVLPLPRILARVNRQVPGDIIELELEHEHDTWVYELKVISPDGRLREIWVDATSGALLEHREDD
jgi:uncharacterized membrane protein YkoI